MAAFRFAWWVMAAITAVGLIPLVLLPRRRGAAVVGPAQNRAGSNIRLTARKEVTTAG